MSEIALDINVDEEDNFVETRRTSLCVDFGVAGEIVTMP